MTRRRKLRPEEQELWHKVAQTADPLHKPTAKIADTPFRSKFDTVRERPAAKSPVPTFELGQKSVPQTETHVFPRTTADRLREAPVQMDAKAFQRLKRGKLIPDSRIDLHGMTVDRAHGALVHFLLNAQARGDRLALVITGKGSREDPYDPMPRRRGVLKTQVPQWLRMAPLSSVVLQVSEAHRKHGGEGAYYVYLRRRR